MSAYRDPCTEVHGLYINGKLRAKCKHCKQECYAISSQVDGNGFWTFCYGCLKHTHWQAG